MSMHELQQTRRAQGARSRLPLGFALVAVAILLVLVIAFTLKAIY